MSDAFWRENGKPSAPFTDETMRSWCRRPGRHDDNGKPIYITEQHHKDTCDVNKIIQKYDKTGLISHVSKIEAKFGDVTGADFQTMQNKVANARSMFMELPSNIRNRFKNDPAALLSFMDNPDNRQEAIELGLIDANWTEDTDGLGEHVLEDGHKRKDTNAPENPPQT